MTRHQYYFLTTHPSAFSATNISATAFIHHLALFIIPNLKGSNFSETSTLLCWQQDKLLRKLLFNLIKIYYIAFKVMLEIRYVLQQQNGCGLWGDNVFQITNQLKNSGCPKLSSCAARKSNYKLVRQSDVPKGIIFTFTPNYILKREGKTHFWETNVCKGISQFHLGHFNPSQSNFVLIDSKINFNLSDHFSNRF